MGLAYFVFLGSWLALAGGPRTWGRVWSLVPVTTVTLGALASIAFTILMSMGVEARCNLCLAVHMINGLLVVGTLALVRVGRFDRYAAATASSSATYPHLPTSLEKAQSSMPSMTSATPIPLRLSAFAACRVMGFAVMLIAGMWMYRNAKLEIRRQVAGLLPYKTFLDERKDDPAFLLTEFYSQPKHELDSRPDWMASTADPASIASDVGPSLVIFSDFQCKHCACFAAEWRHTLSQNWIGPLDVSYRHLPRDASCNPYVSKDVHGHACEAGYAAEAARLQGGPLAFWMVHDILYANAHHLDELIYKSLAIEAGLDSAQFLRDMAGGRVRAAISEDIGLAAELGLTETPTAILNGRVVPELCLHNPVFWEAVSLELNGALVESENSCPAGPMSERAPEALVSAGIGR
jgi:hypothetical protein